MTNLEVYNQYKKMLKNPDVDEINIRILLCDINGYETMSEFYLRKNENIKDLQRFQSCFARFLNDEPIQYILGNSVFFGNKFSVNSSVLIPRQETEEVVKFAIDKIHQNFGENLIDLIDVCTGSGCIGISIAKNAQISRLILSDISKEAIDIAQANLKLNNVNGLTLLSDGLNNVDFKVDVLVSNPPYILEEKVDEVSSSTLKFEPHLALFTTKELSVYKNIFENAYKIKKDGKKLLMFFEIGYDLKNLLTILIEKILPESHYEFHKDMNGKERILFIEID